jgi:hypothetical protein
VALGETTIYRRWDGFAYLKRCKTSKLEHGNTDTCLAWSGDPTNIPQIHLHGIWCDVGRRILTETTICHRGKWISAFLWNDKEKLTRDDQPCLYSPLHGRPLWNTLNLLVMYEGKYRGQWLWEKWQSTVGGTDLLNKQVSSPRRPGGTLNDSDQPCEWPHDCMRAKVAPHFFCFGMLKASESE